MKNKILKTYEKIAQSYHKMIDYKPHNAFYDRPNTLSLFPENIKDFEILDAACGPGKYAEILLSQGAHVTGFDFSPKMVDLAKKRNSNHQENFFVHNLNDPLDLFNDQKFDIVLCALALDYIQDWHAVMGEFNRVLKPNGRLIISTTHPFFNHLYFKSKKYFKPQAVSTNWIGFGKGIKMHSFKRSLHDTIAPITENGFYIEKLLEPKPTVEMKKSDPKTYKKLMNFPSFLCIKAIKHSYLTTLQQEQHTI
jgi:ubiquinone/menaquinone biosynthesis C-methylase UbiE